MLHLYIVFNELWYEYNFVKTLRLWRPLLLKRRELLTINIVNYSTPHTAN